MISRTAEYALRAMVYLAVDPDAPRTVKELAAATRVPEGYLSKVMQGLGRAGLVRSQRGLHGGFALAKSAAELTILEVVDAVDPLPRLESCPLGLHAHKGELCPLHRRLAAATAEVERAFAASTLAELLADPSPSKPLCAVPAPPPTRPRRRRTG